MKQYLKTLHTVDDLHHAIVFESDLERGRVEISQMLGKLNYGIKGNPDLWIETYDLLSVDDAREIRKNVVLRPVAGEFRVGIISFLFATPEAQQALLKTLEELPKHFRLIVITPRVSILLPTILSRLLVISSEEKNVQNNEFEKFITLPVEERIKYIESFLKKRDDLSASKIKYGALFLINTIEAELYKKWDKKNGAVFSRLSTLREYLFDPGSSVKMILEEITLLV